MPSIELPPIAKSVAGEVLKEGVSKLLERYWDKRKRESFEELMKAVQEGKIDIIDAAYEDELAHALWKYFALPAMVRPVKIFV